MLLSARDDTSAGHFLGWDFDDKNNDEHLKVKE
jgi:hypothetical protein